MTDLTVKLTPREQRAVYGWLQERLDEMEPDNESIEEEEPGLLEALGKIRNALEPT